MRLPRRRALILALALPFTAHAADADAVAPIQQLNAALLTAMRAGKSAPFAQRFAVLQPAIERAFDLPAILHASVGLRWATLSPADQQNLLEAFRKFTVSSYAANFDDYSNQRIEVVPSTRTLGADQVVATKITSGGDSTPIDYVMHRTPEGWKAVDVLLNGSISQVAVNRSDWRSLLAAGAGSLIESLQRRTGELSGGAVR